jgi:hypothetical protein
LRESRRSDLAEQFEVLPQAPEAPLQNRNYSYFTEVTRSLEDERNGSFALEHSALIPLGMVPARHRRPRQHQQCVGAGFRHSDRHSFDGGIAVDHGEPQPQHDADGSDHADAALAGLIVTHINRAPFRSELFHHRLTHGVCNISAAGAHGHIITVGTVLRCLVFNLGIELGSEEDDDSRHPHPAHHTNYRA